MPPQPGDLTKTASDASSFTFEARDPDGIYMIEAWYARPDYRRSRYFRTPVTECPATFTITLPRQRTVDGQTLVLKEVGVLDCSHAATGSHGTSAFAIDPEGNAELVRIQETPFHTQKMKEALGQIGQQLAELERRQRLILILLLILFLTALWATLGPLFF